MMKIFKSSLFIGIAFVLLVIGCKSQNSPTHPRKSTSTPSKNPKTLRINLTGEPSTLDPRKARSLNDLNVIKMVMDGLTRINYQGEPSLALAEEVKISDDRLTYTFTLKKIKWSNGESLTAHDFIYAWRKSLSPNFPSDNASLLYVIKNAELIKQGKLPNSLLGVQALDEKTLTIQLEKPIPYLLELLASPSFYPVCAKADKLNPHWAENAETYISCGPFKLETWRHSDSIEVVKNEEYWDSQHVKLKKISMMMVTPETGLNMYENNELDWEGSPLSNIPLDALNFLKEQGKLNTQSSLLTSFIRTNTQKAPFNSIHVRKAFAIAMDRQNLIEHVLHGNASYASGLVPAFLGLRNQEYFQDKDETQAKALIEKALELKEISKEDLSHITLSFLSNEKNYRICQALQEQWKKAFNIDIQLEAIEGKIYFNKVSQKNFQLALGSWVADFRDPINFLEVFKTRDIGTNNTSWENQEYFTKLEQSYTTTSTEERTAILKECEQILIQEMPIIPIWHGTMHYVKNDTVKNVVISDCGGIDFKWAFIDKKI